MPCEARLALRARLASLGFARKDILTREQYKKIREFNDNPSIVTRKADKSNIYVILNADSYKDQLDMILSDSSKFEKILSDPTDSIKSRLNILIKEANKFEDMKFKKREGQYSPGYLYGNPKIHKSVINPPLRPIISQVGSVTFETSKQLNELIIKYLPIKHSVRSVYEFLQMLHSCPVDGNENLASLDVESLFTNVPVVHTIDIILKHVYNHPKMPPPRLPQEILREMLLICTTSTPFHHINGDLYVQIEGVSMGSCLGPTFAEYYMCELENNVFEKHPELKPKLYTRFVDDIFSLTSSEADIPRIIEKFKSNSVLDFTFELEKSQKLSFLDCLITRFESKFKTSVFVKDTNSGDCINYKSICPEKYKTGVIKTLLHRGYHVSSDPTIFNAEVARIKQLLTNNNFPAKVIESEVNKFMEKKNNPEATVEGRENVNLFFQNQMTSQYKSDENKLKSLIAQQVFPAIGKVVAFQIFYKNRKLRSLLIRNKPKIDTPVDKMHHVVYQYTCEDEGCNAPQYIGYTTCTLYNRFGSHTQSGSIMRHLREQHSVTGTIYRRKLLQSVKVLKAEVNKQKLILTEAVLIKDLRPALNSQEEGADKILNIFKH